MKQYPKYKDSGVSWIGEIPEHWKKARYKDVLSIQDEKVGKRNDLMLLSLTKQGVIIRDLTEMKGKFPKDFESYKVVHPNNIILCLFDVDETPRTVGLSHNEGMITGAYDVFSIKNIDKEYFLYHYLSLDDRKAMKPLYKGLRKTIPLPRLMGEHIFIPPNEEQAAIVSFLDAKTAQIDRFIAEAEREIEKLNELKQAQIAHLVTHGLNPDAPMKDSGIAWIGQIPEHWKKARYKDVLSIQDEKVGKRKDLTLLSLTKQGVIIRDLTEMKGKFPKDFESYKVVHPDNIILCLFDVDETPRTVGLSHNEGMITGAYDVFSIKNIDKEYFLYHYLSLDDRKAMKPLYKGLRKTIPLPRLMGEHIFIPPKDEQTSIVSAINSLNKRIDMLTSQLVDQINHLKELKQRIISDAVTGKIDVREVNN
ncbi:restriction endonuclease subunit S [Prevotella salivae]|uniref:restriction endonuclease subunit S n=1 Tax=Segatella salivae TaxID=228604 RepID=UPI001C5DA784|nr:restriction endonuclease subunit S [Segatella salivae]MBW4763432.1 restriction endonuclease subunit S [Segatella salivae]